MDTETDPLLALADAAGIQRRWRDVAGAEHDVPLDRLEAVLEALGHSTGSSRQIVRCLNQLSRQKSELPALVVADAGKPISLPCRCAKAEVVGESGECLQLEVRDGMPFAPAAPGYYDLVVDGQRTRLAAAPPHCPLPPQSGRRRWGAAVQIPALRGAQGSTFGNLGDLAEAVEALGRRGADAVAINPVHALFPGDGLGFSPYSPSSRRFLNTAMGDPSLLGLPALPETQSGALIDWSTALPERLTQLRSIYANLPADRKAQVALDPADANGDAEAVRLHAIFDALDCQFRPDGARGWHDWPARFRNPGSAAVETFAAEHAEEVAFHLFLQGLATKGLATVQQRALVSGMEIGLIGDLAVGVAPGGSDVWALGSDMLRGLTIGAPPDPLGPLGQNWTITSFSPDGLRRSGYAPWIAMLRAALAHAGGLRIDHAFGLARLWVIPDGGDPSDGVYLTYPFADLIRLATLEAHLAGALIIAEDLGTSPADFTRSIAEHHMLGMRVLWFERAADHGFVGAQDYAPLAVALTGTHDTPTVAGWWRGTDLDWAAALNRLPDGVDRAKAEEIRDWDRGLLWSTLIGPETRPAPDDPQPAVDAAISHIAATPCALALVPVEDLLGLEEQPNLPGTITEHPNWRRRLSGQLDELLDEPLAAGRIQRLSGQPANG